MGATVALHAVPLHALAGRPPNVGCTLLLPPQLVTLLYYVASYFPGGASGAQSVIGFAGRGALSVGSAALKLSFSRGSG